MKIKLLALLLTSISLVACGQEKKEETTAEVAAPDKADIADSKVATSIAPVLKKFNGDEYTDTKISGNPDYYIMYFTASW